MMSHETAQKIADVKEAFGVECYWSMAGCFCIEAGDEHIALKPVEGGLWDKLSAAAKTMLDEPAVDPGRLELSIRSIRRWVELAEAGELSLQGAVRQIGIDIAVLAAAQEGSR